MPRHTVRGPYPGGQVRGPEACRVVVVGKRVASPVANASVDTNYWLQSDGQGSTWPPPACSFKCGSWSLGLIVGRNPCECLGAAHQELWDASNWRINALRVCLSDVLVKADVLKTLVQSDFGQKANKPFCQGNNPMAVAWQTLHKDMAKLR